MSCMFLGITSAKLWKLIMLDTSGIPNTIVNAMKDKGYEKLTPVQEEVAKKEYSGLDLLVSAQTGSGKTIAFGIAITDHIKDESKSFKTPLNSFFSQSGVPL